jgi:hypothetical protein
MVVWDEKIHQNVIEILTSRVPNPLYRIIKKLFLADRESRKKALAAFSP